MSIFFSLFVCRYCCCCSHYFPVLYLLLRPPAAQESQGALLVLTSPFSHIDQPSPDPISLWTGVAIKSHMYPPLYPPTRLPTALHPVHSLPALLASAPASVCVCVQPSRSTRVHHGDKAQRGERETACNLRCYNPPPPKDPPTPTPPLLTPPPSLGRGGEQRRGLFGPRRGALATDDRKGSDGGMRGGIPSNVPGYLPPSIPWSARPPPTGHLSAPCKRRGEGFIFVYCLFLPL